MKHWMFTVMYDWFPTLWPTLVKRGLAAQHYPPGWTNEARNLKALQQMTEGDAVVAAFKRHRFAGYGFLKSDFFRGGKALPIVGQGGGNHAFQERAEVDWIVLPEDAEKPYIDCGHLKAEGYDVDLCRGLCVKQVDKRTFTKVRALLDQAGARPAPKQPRGQDAAAVHQVLSFREGKPVKIETERPERNPAARRECIRVHGTACSVCGMSFEAEYGEIGTGYIEVHHLTPIGDSARERIVNPAEDMRPVCPNCHAMLHRSDPVLTIDDLRTRYEEASKKRW